jgi:hypothetical protein
VHYVDTVEATGSIPVSPTTAAPDRSGAASFLRAQAQPGETFGPVITAASGVTVSTQRVDH